MRGAETGKDRPDVDGRPHLAPLRRLAIAASLLAIAALEVVAWTARGLPVGGDETPLGDPSVLVGHYFAPWNWWVDLGSAAPGAVAGGIDVPQVLIGWVAESAGASPLLAQQIYLLLFLAAGALAVWYSANRLLGVAGWSVLSLIAPVLFLASQYWLLKGDTNAGSDIDGSVSAIAILALLLASLLWASSRTGWLRWLVPAGPLVLLLADIPYSIPRVLAVLVGFAGYLIFVSLCFGIDRSWLRNRIASLAGPMVIALGLSIYLLGLAALAGNEYAVHTALVTGYYPLGGYKVLADQPVHVLAQANNWFTFAPEYATAWTTFYRSDPVGILGSYALAVLAWSALLTSTVVVGSRERFNSRWSTQRLYIAVGLLVLLVVQTGTTLPGSTAIWGAVVGLPEGQNLFASAISWTFAPFIQLAYVLLATSTVLWAVRTWRARSAPVAGPKLAPRARARWNPRRRDARDRAAAGAVFALAAMAVVASLPVWEGQLPEWKAGAVSAPGVVVPNGYSQANSWLAAHDTNLSSTMVFPDPGQWPTLEWGNDTGYSGANPYSSLLDSVPVVDGSASAAQAGASPDLTQLLYATYASVDNPAAINALESPPSLEENLSQPGPDLAASATGWSSWPADVSGDAVGWDPAVPYPGSAGSLELTGNDSYAFNATFAPGARVNLTPPEDLAGRPLLTFWVQSPELSRTTILAGVAAPNGTYLQALARPVGVQAGWTEMATDLNASLPGWLLVSASSVTLSARPDSPGGIEQLWLANVTISAGIAIDEGSNLAGSALGWSSWTGGAPYYTNVSWNSTAAAPFDRGVVELETPAGPASFVDGVELAFDSPQNASMARDVEVWFRGTGFAPDALTAAFTDANGSVGYLGVAGSEPYFSAVPVDGWYVALFQVRASLAPYLLGLDELGLQFRVNASAGPVSLELGYVGLLGAEAPRPATVERLLTMLGVGYVLYDDALLPENGIPLNLTVFTGLGFLDPVLSAGSLTIFRVSGAGPPVGVWYTEAPAPSVPAMVAETQDGAAGTTYCVSGTDCSVPIPSLPDQDPAATLRLDLAIGPTNVLVTADGPGVLQLDEAYAPDWTAEVGGVSLPHLELDGYANGWILPAGTNNVTITFTADPTFDALAVATASVAAALGVAALVELLVLPRWGPSLRPRSSWGKSPRRPAARSDHEDSRDVGTEPSGSTVPAPAAVTPSEPPFRG